jgi:PAS domain S-box-containing protein
MAEKRQGRVQGLKRSLLYLIAGFGPIRTAAMMGLLLFAAILFSIFSVEKRQKLAIEETRQLSASYAAAFAEYSELAIFGADQVLQNAIAQFGHSRLTKTGRGNGAITWMHGKLLETNFIVELTTVDAKGMSVLGTSQGGRPADRHLAPSYRYHLETDEHKLHFWGLVYTPSVGRETIEISRRIDDESGGFAGTISGFLDPDFFAAFFRNVNLPKGAAISLYEADGRLLVQVPSQTNRLRPPTNKSDVRPVDEDSQRIGTQITFPRYPLMVKVEMPTAPILAQSRSLGLSYAAFILALSLMSVLVVTLVRTLRKRLKAEEQIRILSLAVENSPMSVIITDAKGQIEYVNPFFSRISGFSPEEVQGQNPSVLKSGHLSDDSYARMWKAITAGHIWHGEFHNKRKDGSSYWELAAIAPIKNEIGSITHFVAVKEDITIRKQAEQDLIEAKEMAEEANRAKSSFLANMSHELRTPLNAVIGFADMLSSGIYGPLNDRQMEAVKDIHHGGAHLLDIINDVLDMSRIEAGRYEISESDVDIRSIVRSSVKLVEPRAKKSDIRIVQQIPEHLPNVWGDERAVKQVILNLISNAVKFTPSHGQVTISAESEERGGLWVSIADTGPGISQEDLERLFQPFQQGEQWLTRQHEGTGLGLAISKKLMEMHGGTIRLDSTLGKGTTVWLRFPPSRTHADGK